MFDDSKVNEENRSLLSNYLENSGMSLWLKKDQAPAKSLCENVEDDLYEQQYDGPDHNCGCGSGSNCSC